MLSSIVFKFSLLLEKEAKGGSSVLRTYCILLRKIYFIVERGSSLKKTL